MATQIRPLDSVSVSAGAAGVVTIPTGTLSDYDSEYDSPFYINVYVTGSGNAYLQTSGSSNAGDGRYIASGASAQYGPIRFVNLPQIRFDAASGAWVSFDALVSEG